MNRPESENKLSSLYELTPHAFQAVLKRVGRNAFSAFVILLMAATAFFGTKLRAENSLVVEDFTGDETGKLPTIFKTYPFQHHKATRVYAVREEDGNRYLSANVAGETQDLAVHIFDRFPWDISKFPLISWRWRARSLPGAPPGSPDHFDDNACGVYVVFGGWSGKALKYIWSRDLPEGKVTEDTPGRYYMTVRESGEKRLGRWQKVTVNVAEDYRKFFKAEPANPTGFGILTDGDGTHLPAACDYDDFTLSGP